jgi:glycerol uptake facilitator protein
MSPFLAEFIGTGFLIILGDGVVANVVLAKTKGYNGGLIAIAFGWAIAVFVGVYASAAASGAHLNPVISIGLAVIGKFNWALVPVYVAGQLLGAMAGALLVWLAYRKHFNVTEDADLKLAVFCTGPAIKSTVDNLLTEFIGTFILMFGVLFITHPHQTLGALDALPVALLVLGIGLSLGGPTGYAINPARDLGPRIMHFILPINGKRDSNWSYSWIPVTAPIVGAVTAALVWTMLNH